MQIQEFESTNLPNTILNLLDTGFLNNEAWLTQEIIENHGVEIFHLSHMTLTRHTSSLDKEIKTF